jgi:hypothetical protein
MTGAITSRPAGDVEAEDFVTMQLDDTVHHASVLTSRVAGGPVQELVLDCQDCRHHHTWNLARTQLVTVQRTPR